ncbi:hypothetical protein HGP28_02550 [Vibrio sp. SM6]|uniref:Uncharacterized protein n=1 Tax=Vibrio agarilyticus TaxID=2726741 RepID=A0A7X8YFD1_9VIBR|nr:hypothetical protein [Vibrio agarilyticus]NLS11768.1 hypothetical protein [Vibrio agarilyticus]
MKIHNALYRPHIQQDLKQAAAFIDNSLKYSNNKLSASLNSHNQIQVRNSDGVVVKTFQGDRVAAKMYHIDEYV